MAVDDTVYVALYARPKFAIVLQRHLSDANIPTCVPFDSLGTAVKFRVLPVLDSLGRGGYYVGVLYSRDQLMSPKATYHVACITGECLATEVSPPWGDAITVPCYVPRID